MSSWHLPSPFNYVTDVWRPGGSGRCWVCGNKTGWLDIDSATWQHPDCDSWPDEEGRAWRVIGGKVHDVDGIPYTTWYHAWQVRKKDV